MCSISAQGDPSQRLKDPRSANGRAANWLHHRKVKAFYNQVTASSLRTGTRAMLQVRPHLLLPLILTFFFFDLSREPDMQSLHFRNVASVRRRRKDEAEYFTAGF